MNAADHLDALARELAQRGYIVALFDIPLRLRATHTALQLGYNELGVIVRVTQHAGSDWFAFTDPILIAPCTDLTLAANTITQHIQTALERLADRLAATPTPPRPHPGEPT